MLEKIGDSDFNEKVIGSKKPVLVDVYADWCQPCKMLAPVLEKLATHYDGKVSIVKLDGESEAKTVTEYKVAALPTLMFFKNGQMVKRLTGLQQEKTIKETLDTLI
jgi:thioredoxin 1